MSAVTRGLGTAIVVGLVALVGAVGCGGSETPRSTRTTTVAPSTSVPPSPTPESVLAGPTIVAARQLSDDSRVLVAYDLDDGTTRELAKLQREDHPTVDATGTAVVLEQYTGAPDPAAQSWRETGTGSHLVLIDLTTGARRELTPEHSGFFDFEPSWNRSGDGWVYFLRSGPADKTTPYVIETPALWRVEPSTGDLQKVPQVPQGTVHESDKGASMLQFVLEPGGHTAWVEAGWCDAPESGCGGAWRLDLRSGHVVRHPFDPPVTVNLAWTPDGAWLAYSANLGGAPSWPELTITPWPIPANWGADMPGGKSRTPLRMPEGARSFGQVGWHPDGSSVVLQTNIGLLLVDITDGSTTQISPASADDQSFDVWGPIAAS
jgi:hypothetical protein